MRKGFTLLEVLVTLIIIGAMASILIPRATKMRGKAKQRQAESYLRAIRISQVMYYARNGMYACSTACSNAAAIKTTLGTEIADGTYVFSMTSPTATTFTATATGGDANLTINQDGAFTKGGSPYTPP